MNTYLLDSCGLSHTGLVRPNNEDFFAVLEEEKFFILADGMGGHRAGEVAAWEAVHYICDAVRIYLGEGASSVKEISRCLRKVVEEASAHVFRLSKTDPEYMGMGTTLSCFLLLPDYLIYAHVGDSRLYRFRAEKGLEQLTLDHSIPVAELETESLVKKRKLLSTRHVITRALGTTPYLLADIGEIQLQANDIYFLCSDGLTDCVPETKIQAILEREISIDEKVDALVHTALEYGGGDNITILMTQLQPTGVISTHVSNLPR